MKCAVLCNGPSRVAYKTPNDYDLVIGCNIPWTDCNFTVISDKALVDVWNANRDTIECDTYMGTEAAEYAKQLDYEFFNPKILGTLKIQSHYHSSGHTAVELAMKLGYNDIDIYGCDAYFGKNPDSYTRQYIPINSPNQELRAVDKMIGWRVRWQLLVDDNPQCRFNFIRK